MILKSYVLFFHFILGTFIAGGFFISMSFFFHVTWSEKLRKLTDLWKKLSLFVGPIYLPLVIYGRSLIPISLEQDHKLFYYSHWFIILRAILASGVLWFASGNMRKNPVLSLILFFVTGTLVAIDWGMSLERHWTSNIYGLIYLLNFALIFFAQFLYINATKVSQEERKDLFHVLITLAIMWGYLHYSQFIILWMGNKPSEVSFYLNRHYPLGLMALILAVKFVPVMSLSFFPGKKTHVRIIETISVLVIIGGWLEVIWLLAPPLNLTLIPAIIGSGIMILASMIGMVMIRRRLI